MRCIICDANDQGLSLYRPDGHFHATKFHVLNGDVYCDECSTEIDETLSDFDLDDEEEFEDD